MNEELSIDKDLFFADLQSFAGAADGIYGENNGNIRDAAFETHHLKSEAIDMYIDELEKMRELMTNYCDLFVQECSLINEMATALLTYDSNASSKFVNDMGVVANGGN